MPVIWQTVEEQDSANLYKFDSFIKGSKLDNSRTAETKWLCYYFFYELELTSAKYSEERTDAKINPHAFKVDYSRVVGQVVSSDSAGIQCQFSDALAFYTQTHFIHTVGVSDLHSHFLDMSVIVQSNLQRNRRETFILAHLLEIEDPLQQRVSDDLRLYHPGDELTVVGYFMDNSGSPGSVRLKFEAHSESTGSAVVEYSDVCSAVQATRVTCRIQQSHSLFGYQSIALVESNQVADSGYL